MKFRKIKTILIVTMLSTSVITSTVLGSSVGELQDKQDDIQKNIDDTNNKIDEKKSSIEEINSQIEKLDKELSVAMNELADINKKLDDVTNELNKAEDDLVKATKEKEEQNDTLQERVRYMYEYGTVSYFDTLLNAKSFSDLINRIEYLNIIHKYDTDLYDTLAQKEKEIQELTETIKSRKSQIEVLQKTATEKRDELQANVDQKEALNQKIQADVNLLEHQLDELDQANKDVESMIQAEIKKQQEAGGGGMNTTYTGGKLMWPSDTTRITSNFGYRIHPITGAKKLHAGVDIGVPVGTNVYAAESGKVITAGWVQGYGNCVIIMHDNGLTTLYGHLSSYATSVGQRVNRGDLIAYSGNSGNSTGPHLHFEVRLNGTAVDPMGYVQ